MAECPCGYGMAIADYAEQEGVSEQFIVVKEEEFKDFQRLESLVREAKTEATKLDAIAAASRYTGCAYTCPRCARLFLILSDEVKPRVYQRE